MIFTSGKIKISTSNWLNISTTNTTMSTIKKAKIDKIVLDKKATAAGIAATVLGC